ncbi:MAG: DUF1054 family protein [Firmicutes bacterium]|nr:DUF1054 family protein [Bacillota bacterium]
MYQFSGFSQADFDVFLIPEFHERMSALRTRVRPKLAMLGDDLAPRLEALTGHPMYPHTASHARRRVNPPDDTWVAFSRSDRGYKRYAHFEVGLARDYAFVRFSVKAESDVDKPGLLQYLREYGLRAFALEGQDPIYYYDNDHGEGPHDVRELTAEDLARIVERTQLKSRGFTMGVVFERNLAVLKSGEFVTRAYNTISHLVPVYEGTLMAAASR